MIFRDYDDLSAVIREFPHELDRARISGYTEARLLRYDRHDEVFARVQQWLDKQTYESDRQKWAALTYLALNLLGLLSRSTAEELFLDPPDIKIDGEDQETLDEVRDASRLDLLLLDAVDRASADGDLVIKAFPDGDGQPVRIDTVDPSIVFRGEDYFPEYAALNSDPRVSVAPFVATPISDDGKWFVHLEIHEAGQVINRVYRWNVPGDEPSYADRGSLGRQVDPSTLGMAVEDYETGYDAPTLWVCRNDAGAHPFWGASDYTASLKGLQDAINSHLSQLTEHGERLMAGGIVVLPESARAEAMMQGASRGHGPKDFGRKPISEAVLPTVRRRSLDIRYESGHDSGVTRFVAETPHYEGAFKLLEILLASFERISGLTIDRLMEPPQVPESGRAMRLARQRDRRRVARKQLRYQYQFSEALRAALVMGGRRDAPLPSWRWADPFPITEDEKAELILKRVGNKPTLSVVSALQRYDGLTEEDAAAETDRLAGEQHTAGVTTFRAPPTTAGDFPDEAPEGEAE